MRGRRRRRSCPSPKTLVGIRASGPEPGERGRGREQLHVRGQRALALGAPARRSTWPVSASTTKQAAGRAAALRSQARIWSQLAACSSCRRPAGTRCAASAARRQARLIASSNTKCGEVAARACRPHRPGIIHVYGQSCGHRVHSRGGGAGRKRPSKTALVLGGGGFTGGVYEIGALRALDLLAVNSTVNDFDVYVGTSAGSFVAGDARQRRHPRRNDAGAQRAGPLRARGPRPRQGAEAQLPRLPAEGGGAAAAHAGAGCARWSRIGEFSAIDIGVGLAEALPTGPLLGRRHRRLRRGGRSPTPAAPTTSACSTASST